MVPVRKLIEGILQEGRRGVLVFGSGLSPDGTFAADIEDFVRKSQQAGRFTGAAPERVFEETLKNGYVYVSSPDGDDVVVWADKLPVKLRPSAIKSLEGTFDVDKQSTVTYRRGPNDNGQVRTLESVFHPEKFKEAEKTAGAGAGSGKPYFGFKMENVGDRQGVRVTDVVAGGPAARAGIKAGDIISSALFRPKGVSGGSTKEYRMVETAGVRWVAKNVSPGDTVRFGVNRGSGWVKLSLVVGSAPESMEESRRETVAEIARRTGKRPEVVCRMLDLAGMDAPDYESQPPEPSSKTGWTKPNVTAIT